MPRCLSTKENLRGYRRLVDFAADRAETGHNGTLGLLQ